MTSDSTNKTVNQQDTGGESLSIKRILEKKVSQP